MDEYESVRKDCYRDAIPHPLQQAPLNPTYTTQTSIAQAFPPIISRKRPFIVGVWIQRFRLTLNFELRIRNFAIDKQFFTAPCHRARDEFGGVVVLPLCVASPNSPEHWSHEVPFSDLHTPIHTCHHGIA